jgi:transcriptional regulator with XRE-family HTH domain
MSAKRKRRRTFRLPSIPSAVEFRREAYGWNRAAMARKLGMQRSHYSEFVQGKRGLPYAACCKAFELGVPGEVLLQTPKTRRAWAKRQREELEREEFQAALDEGDCE